MNIFDLREQLIRDYGDFIRGFLKIGDPGLGGRCEVGDWCVETARQAS